MILYNALLTGKLLSADFFQEYHQSVNQFGSRSGLTKQFVRSDLGPKFLQRLADDTSR